MYLHCHDCDWEQDDFWDETYNPFRALLKYEEALLNLKAPPVPATDITNKQVVIRALRRAIQKVEGMTFMTPPNRDTPYKCPNCESKNLSVD